MRARTAFCVSAVFGFAVSCSLTTATGFTECHVDDECGMAHACRDNYCLPLPAGCRRAEGAFDAGDRIPLAALLPLNTELDGSVDDSEVMGLNAMTLAVFEANDREGIRGHRFGLYVCNTSRDRNTLLTQLHWMVTELGVPAVLTSGSSQTTAAADEPSRTDAGVMIMSATATSPSLIATFQSTQAVWRVAPPDTQQALVIGQLFQTVAPYSSVQTVGVVYEDTVYGQGLASAVQDRFAARSLTTRLVQFTPPMDAGAVVASLLSGQVPRATVVVALPDDLRALVSAAGATAQLSRDAGHAWMMTDIAKDPAIIDATTLPQLVGSLGTAPAQGAGSAYPFFSDRFKARYGVDPADYSYTSHSYDAMYLVMLSAAWASREGGAITGPRMNEGMHKITGGVSTYRLLSVDWVSAVNALTSGVTIDVEGSSGKLDFDYDAGAPSAPYEVWRITPDGGFVTDRIVQP